MEVHFSLLKRWEEHFICILNRLSTVNGSAINILPQIECNILLDNFPTVSETRKIILHMSSGKSPGADAIPADVYKAGGLPMAEKLTELEEGGYPERIHHGCIYNISIQTERKSSSL